CLNLIITMTLCGLWHGAAWTYILFGLLHGVLLSGHRLFRDLARARPGLDRGLHSRLGTAACVSVTFLTMCLTYVVFRAQSLEQAGLILRKLFALSAGTTRSPVHGSGLLWTYVAV